MQEGTLHNWFSKSKSKDGKPGWVQSDGSPCANEPGEKGTPKCYSSRRLAGLKKTKEGKKKIRSADARKSRQDSGQQSKSGAAKPTMVRTFKDPKDYKKHPSGDYKKEGYEMDVNEAKDIKGKGSGTKDACYHKVKSRYSVWPSAYGSGALVKCRRVGAANWGNKSKSESIEWELDEQWTAQTAAKWFVEEGLNEDGIDILIEELGLQDFVELVYELGESTMLTEARAGGVRVEPVNKSGRRVADLSKGARTRAINDLRKKKASDRAGEGEGGSSSMKDALRSQSKVAKARPAVAKARKAQPKPEASQKPKKRSVLDGVARQVLKGMDRHKKAMQMARDTGKTISKAAKVGGAVAKGVASGVKDTVKTAKNVKKAVTNEEMSPLTKKYLEKALGEACWKGYEKKGMKTMFGKRYPNCVKKEGVLDAALETDKKVGELHKKVDNDVKRMKAGKKFKEEVTGGILVQDAQDFTPREIESVDIIKPEPIKGGQLHELQRTKVQTGNMYQVIFGWRGKMMMVKLFFPDASVPNRQKVANALDKMYPGSQLRSYSHSVVDYDDPYINVGEETILEKKDSCNQTPKGEQCDVHGDKDCTVKESDDYNQDVQNRMQSDENRKRTQMRNKHRASRLKQNKKLHSEHSDWRSELEEDKGMEGMTQKGGHKRSTESGAGLTQKGVEKYRRQNPGSKLQTAVTTPPSKLKPGSKAAKRRKSFCARSRGWTGERGKAARRRWNCN